MARLTIGQKAERLLKLLMGLKLRPVAAALAAHGFTQEDLDEGWARFRAVVGTRLSVFPPDPTDDDDLQQLDRLENKWFPVCRVTLENRFPEVAKRVFLNLTQTHGQQVIVSMETFVERVEKLEGQSATAEDQAARQLLHKRGLTPAVLGQSKGLIAKLRTIAPAAPSTPAGESEPQPEAVDKMWGYYLEWSEIVRHAISDRRTLRLLGFLQDTGSDDDDDDK